MIYFKKYAAQRGELLAMCDEELIGRVLKEGKLCIDIDRYASFYKGELLSETDAASRIRVEEIHSANVIGKKAVALLIKCGVVTKADVRLVEDVPIVQVYKVE